MSVQKSSLRSTKRLLCSVHTAGRGGNIGVGFLPRKLTTVSASCGSRSLSKRSRHLALLLQKKVCCNLDPLFIQSKVPQAQPFPKTYEMAMNGELTPYGEHVASSLERMGNFSGCHGWVVSKRPCDLSTKLEQAGCQTEEGASDAQSTEVKTATRVVPIVLAVIIACIFLCAQSLNRTLVSDSDIGAQLRVERMAECQYGCTGSGDYERCVVGCVEVSTETDCDAAIQCSDCALVYPPSHSLHEKCALMCTN